MAVICSDDITNRIMSKLTKLKLLEPIEGHTQESIKIIIEQMIDNHFDDIRPRSTHIHPTIQINEGVKINVKGGKDYRGNKSKYKFHLLEVGDSLVVDEKHQHSVHCMFNDYVTMYKPNWGYEKTNDGYGEYSFKRIK